MEAFVFLRYKASMKARSLASILSQTEVPPVVSVLLPLALPKTLSYLWQGDGAPQIGGWVQAQVGKQYYAGVVVETAAEASSRLKPATALADVPPLSPQTLDFYRWAARYTLSAPGEPLRVALPRGRVPELPKRWPKLKETKADIAVLSEEQQHAVDNIVTETTRPLLLDGVTGSGKTEVYFEVLRRLRTKKPQMQTLLLVPEIALTPQLVHRFTAAFGAPPLVWHSQLGEAARRRTWWQVARGEPCVVIGARSALFLPFQNLGLIVVDEEHDGSYKQDEAFRYHGRDLAVQLARTWQCPVVLSSATPSLETWHHAQQGKYAHVTLPGRFGGATMPRIDIFDLRQTKLPKGSFLSPKLIEEVKLNLARGEQSLLFLNRRGVAPLLICNACGTRRDCPRCDASLTVHGDRLLCHYCGFSEHLPDGCPTCGQKELKAYGPGTRRVAAEIHQAIPQARVAVADSDSVSSPTQMGELLEQLNNNQLDVIVGTQLVTKGHHLPQLTLVGVVDADMGLAHGDLRAAERTFQLLTQVGGRAGRASKPGRVVLQTFDPEQPLFTALQKADREGFYKLELEARKTWGDPPFGRMAAVIVDGLQEAEVQTTARQLAQNFAAKPGLKLLGPAPAPVARKNERWRWRLLVKAPAGWAGGAHAALKTWLENAPLGSGVRLTVDIDPVSFW
jgi:primosomal protein N' (replication factor Y)